MIKIFGLVFFFFSSRRRHTIPQLYVNGEFIGGCDIVREMYETGELQKVFDENNIEYSQEQQ